MTPTPEPDDSEKLEFVIEIVSGRDLLAADKNGVSDPYVKVLFGSKEIHKTKTIKKT